MSRMTVVVWPQNLASLRDGARRVFTGKGGVVFQITLLVVQNQVSGTYSMAQYYRYCTLPGTR